MRCGVPATHVKNVIIWGNHSSTQYPDVHHCLVNMSGSELACFDAVKDDAWLKGEFITVSDSDCLVPLSIIPITKKNKKTNSCLT